MTLKDVDIDLIAEQQNPVLLEETADLYLKERDFNGLWSVELELRAAGNEKIWREFYGTMTIDATLAYEQFKETHVQPDITLPADSILEEITHPHDKI